jgi:toxin ParE1/3/4
MKIIYSTAALADLSNVGGWIAQDNPVRAHSFVDELMKACEGLATMPLRFQLVAGHEESAVRRRPYGSYSIFYSGGDNAVEIIRVLHGARDYERILFPESD